jgi:hypothetical protein
MTGTTDGIETVLADVCAEAFDEWLHRMHGITSSCRHEAEGEGIAAAVRAHLLSDAVVERAAGAHWEAWSFNHASRLGINDAAEHGRAMVRAALAAAVGSDTDG